MEISCGNVTWKFLMEISYMSCMVLCVIVRVYSKTQQKALSARRKLVLAVPGSRQYWKLADPEEAAKGGGCAVKKTGRKARSLVMRVVQQNVHPLLPPQRHCISCPPSTTKHQQRSNCRKSCVRLVHLLRVQRCHRNTGNYK